MVGAVDWQKDMDFWSTNKWSGSFPVKWHIIKNVYNPALRSILLQNNEDKPVTSSRSMQEVSPSGTDPALVGAYLLRMLFR
jgi:YTH domain-containing family protein